MNLVIMGVLSQTMYTETTSNPEIYDFEYAGVTAYWGVYNTYDTEAVVKTEIDDTTPDLYSENVASLDEHLFEYEYTVLPLGFTIYATAQATGAAMSSVVSQYVEVI